MLHRNGPFNFGVNFVILVNSNGKIFQIIAKKFKANLWKSTGCQRVLEKQSNLMSTELLVFTSFTYYDNLNIFICLLLPINIGPHSTPKPEN